MKLALYGIMFISMAVMFWLAYEYRMKGEAKTKWAAVIVAFFALASAVTSLSMDYWVPQLQYKKFRERHLRTQKIAYEALGKHVAELHPNGRVVVVEYDQTGYFESPESEKEVESKFPSVYDSFEKGIAGNATIEARIKVIADSEAMYADPRGRTPSNYYTVELLNAIFKKYKDCDALVLFVGLPMDHETKFQLWQVKDAEKRPSLVLLNTPADSMKKAIRRGYVSLLMLEKPLKVHFDTPLPESDQEVLDSRYVFVTDKNLDEAATAFPRLFNE